MAGVCEGECVGRRPLDEPLTFTSCHSCIKPLKVGNLFCGQAQRKTEKTRKRSEEKVVVFSSFSLFPAKKQEAVTTVGTA